MLVLGRPALSVDEDSDQALTRRKGAPTVNVVLLAAVEPLSGRLARLTALDGSTAITVSDYEWSLDSARFLHRSLVRVPRYLVPQNAPSPRWLSLHVNGHTVVATVGEGGRLLWDGEPAAASYHADFGLYADKPVSARPATQPTYDDDEFDS